MPRASHLPVARDARLGGRLLAEQQVLSPPSRRATQFQRHPRVAPERLEFSRHLLLPEGQLPRVVLRFAKKDDLWVSGMLDKAEELAERPAVIECPVGKGHVVLFANNPMWRYQTQGSHALVFNALLHWDHLGTGRPVAK